MDYAACFACLLACPTRAMTFSDPLASCSFGGGDNVGAHPLAGGCSLALSRSLSLSLSLCCSSFSSLHGQGFQGIRGGFWCHRWRSIWTRRAWIPTWSWQNRLEHLTLLGLRALLRDLSQSDSGSSLEPGKVDLGDQPLTEQRQRLDREAQARDRLA